MKHTIFNPAEYLEHNGNNKPDNKRTANGSNATHDNALNATHCDNLNATPHDTHYTTPDDTLARVAEVADRVAASGRDITQGYDNWLRLAFALSDGLGEAGRQIFVNRLAAEKGAEVEFATVLLIDNDGDVKVGAPYIEGAKVKATVLDDSCKGDKVLVFKKRRRKGYQKCNGHRQYLSKIQIEEIA